MIEKVHKILVVIVHIRALFEILYMHINEQWAAVPTAGRRILDRDERS